MTVRYSPDQLLMQVWFLVSADDWTILDDQKNCTREILMKKKTDENFKDNRGRERNQRNQVTIPCSVFTRIALSARGSYDHSCPYAVLWIFLLNASVTSINNGGRHTENLC
jgi:hypothetical protein